MQRLLGYTTALSLWLFGCQFISGVNDLEVTSANDEGAGGTGGGSGGSSSDSSTTRGAQGGSANGKTNTGGTGGTGGTENPCTDRPNWECDLLTNCGCDDALENCSYDVSIEATVCQPVGSQEPYSDCIDNQDCPLGHGCIGSVCKKHCNSAGDCGWANADCLEVFNGDTVIEGVRFCSAECNLRDPRAAHSGSVSCTGNTSCYPVADADGSLENTLCIGTDGDAQQGDSCLDANSERDLLVCGAGYFCSALSNTCQAWCEVGGSDCEQDAECIGFEPPLEVGNEELGTCFTCTSGDWECSLFPACGCAEGEACQVVDFDTGEASCGAPGSSAAGGTCETQVDCSDGTGCVSGFCRPFCQGPDTNTCSDGQCLQAYSGDVPIPGVFYCDVPCEPVLTRMSSSSSTLNCGDGFTCLPLAREPTEGEAGAYCQASSGATEGEACQGQLDCANGYGCIDELCVPWCRSDDDCSSAFPSCLLELNTDRFVAPDDPVGLCVASPAPEG